MRRDRLSEGAQMPRTLEPDRRAQGLLCRLAADQRGVAVIIIAIALAVLLGFAGLAIDVAAWLNATRGMQAAADQAAYSAAVAGGASACAGSTTALSQADAVAGARGYVDGQKGTEVDATFIASKCAYTVKISQPQPMWFSRLFLSKPPTASASATARVAGKQSDLCVLAIDGTDPSEGHTGSDANALYVTGSSGINVHCGVAVDSSSLNSLEAGSNAASLSATDIYMVGDDQAQSNGYTPSITSTGCSTCNPVIPPNTILKHQIAVSDPYANRTIPDHDCAATAQTSVKDATINPGTFCGGLSLDGSITVACGTYIIAGGALSITSTSNVVQDPNCTEGITFILTNSKPGASDYATITYNGNPNSQLVLTAPTSGPYGGLVFFQDRQAPNPNTGNNNSSNTQCGSGAAQNSIAGQGKQVITGAIYFPAQAVCFGGGSSSNNANKCTQLIAFNLNFVGNADLESQCSGVGISAMSVAVPQLIE
jgi:Flp pilus assembly protein TadG